MKTEAQNPAFPKITPDGDRLQNGLTTRECFAAMAMQGMLAGRNADGMWQNEDMAKDAVNLADALIEALNKEEK